MHILESLTLLEIIIAKKINFYWLEKTKLREKLVTRKSKCFQNNVININIHVLITKWKFFYLNAESICVHHRFHACTNKNTYTVQSVHKKGISFQKKKVISLTVKLWILWTKKDTFVAIFTNNHFKLASNNYEKYFWYSLPSKICFVSLSFWEIV